MQNDPNLGRDIPWPRPPRGFEATHEIMKKWFQRWRAYKILSKYPRDDWPQIFQKLVAMDKLKGKRNNWGITRYVSPHCTIIQ